MYAEGLKVLRKIAEDERNWRSGMQQIEALLQAAEKADAALRQTARQQHELEQSIARLVAEETALQQSVANFSKKLGTLKADHTAREAPLLEQLAALEREIAEKRKTLADLNAGIEKFFAQHGGRR